MKEIKDKDGRVIEVGLEVEVPHGTDDDIWTYEFVGRVADIHEDGIITVEDQDSDSFDMEADRVRVYEGE